MEATTLKGDVTPEYLKNRTLILGCGNLLFGDDGFGPATIEYIEKKYEIPNDVYVMDVGTGANRVLIELTLSEKKPKKIIILDAMDLKRKPGQIFEIQIEDLPKNKVSNFLPHLFPAVNLLKVLQDVYGVDISILACQIKRIPELVKPGLSEPVKKSVPKAARMALELARFGKATS